MGVLAVIMVAGFFQANADFFNTARQQQDEGYSWSEANCIAHTKGLPALTIDSPNGNQWICYKLTK